MGEGAIEEWHDRCHADNIEVIVVDARLTPVQQRNLERGLEVKVLDRTALILEIFGARARTKEGRLQVDLAQLSYQRSRLVRSWTHLERQRGGAGFMGGPGESQLEIDRRLIAERIDKLKSDLAKVRLTRKLQREWRQSTPVPVVAIVGYTNAGKSTLFNRLTDADVMAKDMLFATLDPTLRKFKLPSGQDVVFADTVGFVSDLPHELVDAFRATLEEVQQADSFCTCATRVTLTGTRKRKTLTPCLKAWAWRTARPPLSKLRFGISATCRLRRNESPCCRTILSATVFM